MRTALDYVGESPNWGLVSPTMSCIGCSLRFRWLKRLVGGMVEVVGWLSRGLRDNHSVGVLSSTPILVYPLTTFRQIVSPYEIST